MRGPLSPTAQDTPVTSPDWVKHSQRVGALISVFISEASGSLARLYPWLPGCLWGPPVGTEPLSPHSRHSALVSQEELFLLAQDRQRMKPPDQGPATLVKNCFLPLREYFKYFSTELTSSL